jgi:2-polyprenyl-3-methyl-5-hydroxy-6-metoxy-1,4-benzoquinol methylase
MQNDYGRVYADLYRRHWWWRSRERMLMRVLRGLALPQREMCRILDVGCGDGLFFPKLREFGSVEGIEIDTSLLSEDNPDRALIQTKPLGDPVYAGKTYDLITALDVVEHIEDDASAVRTMVSMLNPGGYLVMTVPAFMSLWDHHDEINQHYRRYTKRGVERLFETPARLVDSRYLFHAVFVPKYLVSLVNKGRKKKVAQTAIPPRVVNAAMAGWCDAENAVTRPLRIPFGTSVLAVARRMPGDRA